MGKCHCSCYEGVLVSGGIDPFFLNLETRLRLMVSFTSQPLCHRNRGWVDPISCLTLLDRRKSLTAYCLSLNYKMEFR